MNDTIVFNVTIAENDYNMGTPFFTIPDGFKGKIIVNIIGNVQNFTFGKYPDGTGVRINNSYGSETARKYADRIFWNFPNPTLSNITMGNFELIGSVLAPYSTFTATSGNVNGTLVCKNLVAYGSGFEVHTTTHFGHTNGTNSGNLNVTNTYAEEFGSLEVEKLGAGANGTAFYLYKDNAGSAITGTNTSITASGQKASWTGLAYGSYTLYEVTNSNYSPGAGWTQVTNSYPTGISPSGSQKVYQRTAVVTVNSTTKIEFSVTNAYVIYDAALRKWVSAVNGNHSAFAQYDPSGPTSAVGPVRVKRGDLVTYTIRIFNQCAYPLKTPVITDDLPAWLEWYDGDSAPNNTDNKYQGWTYDPVSGLITYDYSDRGGAPILYPANDPQSRASEDSITITLRVKNDAPANTVFTNIAEITELTDEKDTVVEDVDSDYDDDLGNDGTEDGGDLKDNVIDEHRKGINDNDEYKNYGPDYDEDDHDIAKIIVEDVIVPAISVEVDKDTIKRTSAAFIDTAGASGINNVADEKYRYDIDFRSTSNLPAEYFWVDDPLENVAADQVRLDQVVTPAVWGDADGAFNVLVQTKNGGAGLAAAAPSSAKPISSA
jgi:hypothetical protein